MTKASCPLEVEEVLRCERTYYGLLSSQTAIKKSRSAINVFLSLRMGNDSRNYHIANELIIPVVY